MSCFEGWLSEYDLILQWKKTVDKSDRMICSAWKVGIFLPEGPPSPPPPPPPGSVWGLLYANPCPE